MYRIIDPHSCCASYKKSLHVYMYTTYCYVIQCHKHILDNNANSSSLLYQTIGLSRFVYCTVYSKLNKLCQTQCIKNANELPCSCSLCEVWWTLQECTVSLVSTYKLTQTTQLGPQSYLKFFTIAQHMNTNKMCILYLHCVLTSIDVTNSCRFHSVDPSGH